MSPPNLDNNKDDIFTNILLKNTLGLVDYVQLCNGLFDQTMYSLIDWNLYKNYKVPMLFPMSSILDTTTKNILKEYKQAANANNIYAIYGCYKFYALKSIGQLNSNSEHDKYVSKLYKEIYDHALENYNNNIDNDKIIISYLNKVFSQNYKNNNFKKHLVYLCIYTLTSNSIEKLSSLENEPHDNTEIINFIKSFTDSGNINAIVLYMKICNNYEEKVKYLKIAADVNDCKIDNSEYVLKYAENTQNYNEKIIYTLKYYKYEIAKMENNTIHTNAEFIYDYASLLWKYSPNSDNEAIKYFKKQPNYYTYLQSEHVIIY